MTGEDTPDHSPPATSATGPAGVFASSPGAVPRLRITVEGYGEVSASCEERVLTALERAQSIGRLKGLPRKLPVGCRRGGCGICRARVIEGEFRASPMSRAHVSETEQAEGLVLSCAIYPLTDLTLRLETAPVSKAKGR